MNYFIYPSHQVDFFSYGAPLGSAHARALRGSPLSFPRCPALLQSPPFILVTIIPCANASLTLKSCEGIFQCLHSEGWLTRRSFALECWCKRCCASILLECEAVSFKRHLAPRGKIFQWQANPRWCWRWVPGYLDGYFGNFTYNFNFFSYTLDGLYVIHCVRVQSCCVASVTRFTTWQNLSIRKAAYLKRMSLGQRLHSKNPASSPLLSLYFQISRKRTITVGVRGHFQGLRARF